MAYQGHIISSQPEVSTITASSQSSKWSSGVFDCCEDMSICLFGTFVPCILACQVAEKLDECCCLPYLPGTLLAMRTSIRERYHIPGTICDDWLMIYCCGYCALCQMAREMDMRK
ncbi:cornifelin homolog A-like [Protopterus annectens]|uniref:cornifelin homolog A-like n=1 Tax=Protopterus annectens TaxID=7888 RepID=UPI001CFA7ED2|nr:cornifelin homolog A-like [Protopterus annectens]